VNIVSLLFNKIQILYYKSPVLGKKQVFTSSVTLPPQEAMNFNLDSWALELKKALDALPEKLDSKKVRLILGQQFFRYLRLELPPDLTDNARLSFIKEQLEAIVGAEAKDGELKYLINDYKGKQYACVYLLTAKTAASLTTLFSFYDLKVTEIYPEALLIFTLFQQTLNKQKEEAALFLEYEPSLSTGLLFDSVGLVKESVITINSQEIEAELKTFKKEQELTVARLILGGSLASSIRQDNFTKESGIWTNPLEKVLANSSLKQSAQRLGLQKELLPFSREITLLNLILNKKQSDYLFNTTPSKLEPLMKVNLKRQRHFSLKPIVKPLLLIIVSSVLTFAIVRFGGSGIAALNKIELFPKKITTPTPTATPTKPKKTPTPIIKIQPEEITIEILNGSGTPGMASTLESKLMDLDYQVASVGNADNYDYTNTVIIAPNRATFKLVATDLKEFGVAKPEFEQTNENSVTIIFGTDLTLSNLP
jgi:hypothetical protein